MSDLQNIKDELNEFAPELSRMKKQEGFEVPPQYFDRLGDEIIRQIKGENAERQEAKRPWFSTITDALQSLLQPRLAIGLATMVLLFIGVQQFMPDQVNDADNFITFEDLTDEDLNNYIADNFFDFEEDLFFDLSKDDDYLPEMVGDEDLDQYFEDFGEELDFSNLEDLL